jgi:DNA-binding HxlR family transcriptional regulator
MVSISKILDKGAVYVPHDVLQSLALKEGSEIVWKHDPQTNRFYIERNKPQTFQELERAKLESGHKSQLLFALTPGPKTFNELQGVLRISSATLAKALEECQTQELIEHKGRNKPYSLTQRGLELLRISKPNPVKGNDVAIETVREGPFIGSIVLRLPSRLGKEFAEHLYKPSSIEDMNRIMLISLEFWVMRHSQTSPYVRMVQHGKDFNGDGIEDLIIAETPPGYPNIRQALKENRMPMPLWDYCLKAAEEKLSRSS